MPTGEKEYATICEPCGRGDGGVGNSYRNNISGRRVDNQSEMGRRVDTRRKKTGREEPGRRGSEGESCVSKVEALCRSAGVVASVLGACSRPVAFCEGNRRRRRRRSTMEKHFVGGRAWPEKEEGLNWRSSLPGRRGRRIVSGQRRRKEEKGKRKRRKGERRDGGVMECNCKRVEVGQVMEERQVLCFLSFTRF